MFKVEVIGNLGADVEIKNANGSQFATFRLAHVDKWTDQQGNKKEVTTWIDCTYNNLQSKVLEYLKTGVRVFVRGNASLRVYSSPKDRMMKAGIQIACTEIELVGGTSDQVPRQLIEPNTGALLDVQKYYWVQIDTKGWKKDDVGYLIDTRANQFMVNKQGFVAPVPAQAQEQTNESVEGEKVDSNAQQS